MTEKEFNMIKRINKYAEEVLGDIEPQKVQVSRQLDALRPIFTEIAAEENITLEEMFIKYMDLQSEASLQEEMHLRETFAEQANDPENPMLFR
ncbi:MAG: hypothetical protein LUE16_04330 [Lachnospiraceae bacterium]|nr:hypothetical protein [Lachnospiraceae bacterium]